MGLYALKHFLRGHSRFQLWSSHLTEEAALRHWAWALWTLPNPLLPWKPATPFGSAEDVISMWEFTLWFPCKGLGGQLKPKYYPLNLGFQELLRQTKHKMYRLLSIHVETGPLWFLSLSLSLISQMGPSWGKAHLFPDVFLAEGLLHPPYHNYMATICPILTEKLTALPATFPPTQQQLDATKKGKPKWES